MICKNCGNEIPDDSEDCFICGEIITKESKKIDELKKKSTPNSSNDISYKEYKTYKRQFYISLCCIPILLLFLYGIYAYYDKLIGILFFIICTYIGITEMVKLYKKIKEGKRIYG